MINEAKTTKVLGYISAFTSAILMGTIGVFVRNISSNAQIITFSRLFLGLLFLTILLLFTKRYEELKVKLTPHLFFSGVFMSLAILFYIESINHTTLANAVILLYLGPLIATVIAHFLLKERVELINIVLIVVAFSGVGFFLKFNFSFDLESNYGYIFGIISAIWYSFYIIANRKISKNIPIVSRSFYQFFFGALLISPFLFLGNTGFLLQDIPYLILIGFINGFLAINFLILALNYLKAFECGTLLYIEPIIATILGMIFFSEIITISHLIGGMMILGSGLAQIALTIKRNNA